MMDMPAEAPLFRRLKDGVEGFSRNHRVLARYVLAHHQTVAFSTITQLAEQSGVSEATIIRFARALSFKGYPDFQKEIRRLVRAELRGPERLRQGAAAESAEKTSLDRVVERERENLATLRATFDARAFGKAVALLRKASEIMVVGDRSAAPLARHLWFALGKLDRRACCVTAINSEAFDQVSRLREGACLAVIGFPRYLREQVRLLAFARTRKLSTLAITDSVFSPYQGDVSLYAPAESTSFMAFHCAPLVLVNTLLHELSVADEAKTLAALEHFDQTADRLAYFVKE